MPATATPAGSAAPDSPTVQLPARRTLSVGGRQGRGDPPAVHPFRRFRVEYDADGAPFVWEGEAVNEQAAIRCAAHDLAVCCPNFTGEIRATTVIEVAA